MHLFLICVFDTWALLLGLYGRYFYIVHPNSAYNTLFEHHGVGYATFGGHETALQHPGSWVMPTGPPRPPPPDQRSERFHTPVSVGIVLSICIDTCIVYTLYIQCIYVSHFRDTCISETIAPRRYRYRSIETGRAAARVAASRASGVQRTLVMLTI